MRAMHFDINAHDAHGDYDRPGTGRAKFRSLRIARFDRDKRLFRFDSSRYLRLPRRSHPGIARLDQRPECSTTPRIRWRLDVARTAPTEPVGRPSVIRQMRRTNPITP
jgi:hypothetical protein